MVYAYIGAALVVGILIGIIALAIYWMAARVTRDIERKTRQLVSAYDEILDRKSRQLSHLSTEVGAAEEKYATLQTKKKAERRSRRKVQRTESENEMPKAVRVSGIIGGADYIDGGAGEIYKTIRNGLTMTPEEALSKHAPYVLDPSVKWPAESVETGLLKKLSFDTVYEISLLSEQEQLALLSEELTGDERKVLEEYMAENMRFNMIDFCDYLVVKAGQEQSVPILHVAERDAGKRYPAGIRVVVDDDICEGFLLEADNKLYDYSVRGREIS